MKNKKLIFGASALFIILIIIPLLNIPTASAGISCNGICTYNMNSCNTGLSCIKQNPDCIGFCTYVCRNASCPTDLDCICPTCNQTCSSNVDCGNNEVCFDYSFQTTSCGSGCGGWFGSSCPSGMTCVGASTLTNSGKCRNTNCQSETDCICSVCRNSLCPNDEDCICSFGCNASCYSDSQCISGFKCYGAVPNSGIAGNCRNPDCSIYDNCDCFRCQNDSNCNDNNANTRDLCQSCFSCSFWGSVSGTYCYFPSIESDPGCYPNFYTPTAINSTCYHFPRTAERNNCFDGKDNDGDGKIDYKDEDCVNMQLKTMYVNKVENSPLYINITYQNLGNSSIIITNNYVQNYHAYLLIPLNQINSQNCPNYGFGASGWPMCSFNYSLNKCVCPLIPISGTEYQIYHPNFEINRIFNISIKNRVTSEILYLEGDYQIRALYGVCTSATKVQYSGIGDVWDNCILKESRDIDFSLQRNCYYINGQNYCCGVNDTVCPADFEDFEGNPINCGEIEDPNCYVAPIPCRITSASITPNCDTDGVCNASVDKINMSITVEDITRCSNVINGGKMEFTVSSQTAPDAALSSNNERMQPDLSFDSFQTGTCSLAFNNTSIITRSGNIFNATWTVQIPAGCYGKTVRATNAKLYNSSNILIASTNSVSGSFTFAQQIIAPFVSLYIEPGENISMNRGTFVTYKISGIKIDGTMQEITSLANYNFLAGGGNFTQSPKNNITAKTNAELRRYELNISYLNLYKIVNITILNQDANVLSSIILEPTFKNLYPGQNQLYSVKAYYSNAPNNGIDKTTSSKFNSSDENIAYKSILENNFTAKNIGTAIIRANYTEGTGSSAITRYTQAYFNVQMPQETQLQFIRSYLNGPDYLIKNTQDFYYHWAVFNYTSIPGGYLFEVDKTADITTTFLSNETSKATFVTPKNKINAINIGIVNISSNYTFNSVKRGASKNLRIIDSNIAIPRNIILTPKTSRIAQQGTQVYSVILNYTNNTRVNLNSGQCTLSQIGNIVDISGFTITGRMAGVTTITTTCTITQQGQSFTLIDTATIEVVSGIISCTCPNGVQCGTCGTNPVGFCTNAGTWQACAQNQYCDSLQNGCADFPPQSTCLNYQNAIICSNSYCFWNGTGSTIGTFCNQCNFPTKPSQCSDYKNGTACSTDACRVGIALGTIAGADCSNGQCVCIWQNGNCNLQLPTGPGQTCTYTSTNIGECGIACPPGQRKIEYISSQPECNRAECVACAGGGTKPLPGFDFKNLIFVLLLIAGYYAYTIKKK